MSNQRHGKQRQNFWGIRDAPIYLELHFYPLLLLKYLPVGQGDVISHKCIEPYERHLESFNIQ
jgi:hypothetical protein